MPRPKKWRNVCCLPENSLYGPLNGPAGERDSVTMTIDEYETIRLIDLEGFSQEECSAQMNVSRSTVQGIYESARKKLAQSLTGGSILRIEGGDYRLCSGASGPCGGRGCRRRHCERGGFTPVEAESAALGQQQRPAGPQHQTNAQTDIQKNIQK